MSTTTKKPRVAFQGERGAFSEEAALKLLGPELELVPRRTFADLYESLDNGVADYVLAPVENSIAGVVQPSVDLLNSKSLRILDEIQIKIEQHLIGCDGATIIRKSIQDSAENYTRFVLLSASTEQKLEPSTLEVKEYAS